MWNQVIAQFIQTNFGRSIPVYDDWVRVVKRVIDLKELINLENERKEYRRSLRLKCDKILHAIQILEKN
jgi:hypothetical protein